MSVQSTALHSHFLLQNGGYSMTSQSTTFLPLPRSTAFPPNINPNQPFFFLVDSYQVFLTAPTKAAGDVVRPNVFESPRAKGWALWVRCSLALLWLQPSESVFMTSNMCALSPFNSILLPQPCLSEPWALWSQLGPLLCSFSQINILQKLDHSGSLSGTENQSFLGSLKGKAVWCCGTTFFYQHMEEACV